MDLSSAKLSSTFPSSCREKQVRWHVSSRSINTWWISWTISWGDTWCRRRGREVKLTTAVNISRDDRLENGSNIQLSCFTHVLSPVSTPVLMNCCLWRSNPYLQVKWLRSRCLDLHSEARVLDHYHFLFVGLLSSVCLAVPILLWFGLLRVAVSAITIHHGCICTVSCNGRDKEVISELLHFVMENLIQRSRELRHKIFNNYQMCCGHHSLQLCSFHLSITWSGGNTTFRVRHADKSKSVWQQDTRLTIRKTQSCCHAARSQTKRTDPEAGWPYQ